MAPRWVEACALGRCCIMGAPGLPFMNCTNACLSLWAPRLAPRLTLLAVSQPQQHAPRRHKHLGIPRTPVQALFNAVA